MKHISLTQGQVAVVDDDDYDLVNQFKWYAKWAKWTQSYYAARNVTLPDGKRTTQRMNTFLMGGRADHVNGDTLDNRRDNLRVANHSQNGANRGKTRKNTSGYKGVYWNKKSGKWKAQIGYRINGARKVKGLGYFDDLTEAAKAYDRAAVEMHGEFARINFPHPP